METIINRVETSFKKTMTIINKVGKPSRNRIVKTTIKNSIKTVEILSKDEE